MATTVWNNDDADNSWANANNWSKGKPGSGDVAQFKAAAGTVDHCIIDEAVNVLGIDCQSSYTGAGADDGHLDNSGDYAVTIGADGATFANKTLTLGTGNAAWSCSGSWSHQNVTTLNRGTSTVTLSGTGETVAANTAKEFHHVVISGTYSCTAGYFLLVGNFNIQNGASLTISRNSGFSSGSSGAFTLDGTLTISSGYQWDMGASAATTLAIGATGELAIEGTYYHYQPPNGAGITQQSGTVSGAGTLQYQRPASGCILAPGIYGCAMVEIAKNNTGTSYCPIDDAGAYTFTGKLYINNTSTGTISWDASSVTSITYQGDVEFAEGSGSITYTKGAAINVTGASSQSLDFAGKSIGALTVNKSAGDLVLADSVTLDSFTGTSTGTGDFDPVGYTITMTGNCSWAAAFLFDAAADCMNGCTWDIGGNFTADGQDLYATAVWYLQVHGTAVASGTGYVEYSNADGSHTEIDASAGPWTHDGNCTNWNFGVSGAISGSTSITFTPSATLGAVGALLGSTTISVTPSGSLVGIGALIGGTSVALTPTSTIQATGDLAGTTSASFVLAGAITGTGTVFGSTSLTLTPIGIVAGVGSLSGSTSISFTPTAAIDGRGSLAGITSVIFTPTGDCGAAGGNLDGNTGITFALMGLVEAVGALAGSGAITIAPSGLISATGALAGETGFGLLKATIPIHGIGALIGASSVAFTTVGVVKASGALLGTTSLTITPSGTLTATGPGAIYGTTSLQFTGLGRLIAKAISGPFRVMTGQFYTAGAITGQISAVGTVAGQINIPGAVAGNIAS